MTRVEIDFPGNSHSTSAYSPAILSDGWLFVSGQGPLDLQTGKIAGSSIEDQTRLVLERIRELLTAGGCSFEDVVKCTCYLQDIRDFEQFNKIYGSFFETKIRPARTTIQAVLWGGIKVEIDAIARLPVRH